MDWKEADSFWSLAILSIQILSQEISVRLMKIFDTSLSPITLSPRTLLARGWSRLAIQQLEVHCLKTKPSSLPKSHFVNASKKQKKLTQLWSSFLTVYPSKNIKNEALLPISIFLYIPLASQEHRFPSGVLNIDLSI